jgi:hypothetical protein
MPGPDRDKAPRGRRPIGLILGILVVVVVTGFLALRSETGQMLLGDRSFVRSIADDRGTYYRLKVKLTYNGEPQDFDIVVGCNVRRITYKDGSGTYEAGLIPTVFGRRMSDGKGLVVRHALARARPPQMAVYGQICRSSLFMKMPVRLTSVRPTSRTTLTRTRYRCSSSVAPRSKNRHDKTSTRSAGRSPTW